MSETGWPLIPRELLPAPIKPVRHPRPAGEDARPPSGRQLSIFGAETTEPSPADLAGLLAGPGRLQRMGGTARIIVRVDAGWRVHVLMNELVRRGLVVSWHPLTTNAADVPTTEAPTSGRASTRPATPGQRPDPEPGGPIVETDELADDDAGENDEPADHDSGGNDEPAGAVIGGGTTSPVAPMEFEAAGAASEPATGAGLAESDEPDQADDSGESGTITPPWHVPLPLFEVRTAYSSRLNPLARGWPQAADGLFLSGPRMRLWVAAAGYRADGGFRLARTGDQDTDIVHAALVRAGLDGSVAADRRSYLIMGERRLARLAELVGQRPAEAPPDAWPGGVPA